MVLQRTIDNLKDRPKHEREAVAFWIAVAVVVILLFGWGIFFFSSITPPDFTPVNDAYTQAVQQVQTNTPKDSTGWVSNASQTASNTSPVQIIQESSADSETTGI